MNWWTSVSGESLLTAEERILRVVQKPYIVHNIQIEHPLPEMNGGEQHLLIRTLVMGEGKPLVLFHGFGSALGLWVHNLDTLADHFRVYCVDLPGFGLSSRPVISFTGPDHAEEWMILALKAWVGAADVPTPFFLLGHSFGGFIASAYALRHPEDISRLILADPWGIPAKPAELPPRPFVIQVAEVVVKYISPMTPMRYAGPLGSSLFASVRKDIPMKFIKLFPDESGDISNWVQEPLPSLSTSTSNGAASDTDQPLINQQPKPWPSRRKYPSHLRPPKSVVNYIHQINVRTPATGESAFFAISIPLAWAANPMVHRLPQLASHIKVLFLYGSHTWMDINPAVHLQRTSLPHLELRVISDSGHHIYADNTEEFHSYVIDFLTSQDGPVLLNESKGGSPNERLEEPMEIAV